MIKYFDEEWPKEEELLKIGLEQSKRHKRERMKRIFCIGNGESRVGFDLERLRKLGTIYGCNAIYRDFLPDVLVAVDHGIMHEIYHDGIAQKIPCYFRDWTKVPFMMYDDILAAGMDKLEVDKAKADGIVVENERNDSQEFVIHGGNLKGMVNIIKQDGQTQTKHVDHNTVKVSWIQKDDKSHSLSDIMKPRDHGWACGASAGFVGIHREEPHEVYLIGQDLYSHTEKVNNIYKSTRHYVASDNSPTPAINWINQWKTLMDWNPQVKFIKINRFNDGRDKVNGPIDEWKGQKNLEYSDYSSIDKLA